MSNINIAEKIIVQALAADPRTANIRVSRNRNMIMLSEEVDADESCMSPQERQRATDSGYDIPTGV